MFLSPENKRVIQMLTFAHLTDCYSFLASHVFIEGEITGAFFIKTRKNECYSLSEMSFCGWLNG